MRSQKIILKNKIGLHARPAAIFVKKARNYDSEIIIKKGFQEANGKSIISIMALGAMKGDELVILTKGSDEDKAINELSALLEAMEEEE
ncbi:MAG: HPr family phosphocarrier protein [Tissierellia bacterium]|nr:HPr family phosphocarrier protein [Tissierellia bacterium]MDD4779743.1 HPr family phosphocarrier protein [Tissierellia bacterium]